MINSSEFEIDAEKVLQTPVISLRDIKLKKETEEIEKTEKETDNFYIDESKYKKSKMRRIKSANS